MASSAPSKTSTRLERDTHSTFPHRLSDRNRKGFNKHAPVNLFTQTIIPRTLPASRVEKVQVRYFQQFRKASQKGPLYAVLKDSARLGSKRATAFNPFEDVDRYTKQFKEESQSLARFDEDIYCLDFFPDELQEVISPRRSGRSKQPRRRGLQVDSTQQVVAEAEHQEKANAEPVEEDDVQDSDDAAVSESNVDDDFEDDESEMAGDYNAEGYFDDGEDDGDVLDGEGGEDAAGFD